MCRSYWTLLICDSYMPTMAAFPEFTFLHVRDCIYFAFDRQVLSGPNQLRILCRMLVTSSLLAYNLFESCSCMIMMSNRVKAFDAAMNFISFLNCIIQEIFEKSILSVAKKHPNFQVTVWLQNDTTNTNFAYTESE